MPVYPVVNASPVRFIVWATLTLTFFLLLVHEKVSCQEKRTISHPGTLSVPLSPKAVTQRAIAEINCIRNVMIITQEKAGLPYMRNVFREPWIAQTFMSVNRADTIQGGSFQLYILEDTFRLRKAYDGNHLVEINDEEPERVYVTDLRKHPDDARRIMGSLHLSIRNIMEQALKRNATLNTTEENDSLKLEVLFPDLYIELEANHVVIAKDTAGFVSRYVIYLDKHTFLPIKLLRDMPHQTSVETILFQRINFIDTLAIDALKTPAGSVTTTFALPDSLPAAKRQAGISDLIGKSAYEWRLAQVDGDTVCFMTLKGKKSVIVFNSVGWKPCMQVLPFLTRLAATPGVTVVSIEPFVTNRDALKKHRETQAIGYPIVMTNRTLKKTYPGVQVPTFLLVDAGGIVREVIAGYTGPTTEAAVQQALQRLH
ncbi:TlpA family protein disulfide reductase [Parachryseolinea silvisoli]|uniref:TlpA family protein disulfide reductase n=1 Tax=Parachryseolinea silvisoli TaxID=2873601 RepID=UPI00226584FA|nr:TlpA family protein disulfide reductase [Parachryseolinea silvisoli]MCD9017480.1 TlpA family protein disulfide reductase [Parachryseolinea silvisoli]